MQLDQLVAFDLVARDASFSRAALSLGLGQPAISARIQALEESVGGTLFVRGRNIRLTALGESFLPYVRRALEVLREGAEASRLAQEGQRGAVRLGALGSLAAGLVGPALARFVRRHPGVEYTIRSANHEVLLEMLLDGVIDAALTVWPATAAVELRPVFTFREPIMLIAHPKHPLARRRRVTAADVAELARPLFRLRWWPAHDPRVLALADQSRSRVDVAMEPALHLVRSGIGAGFFSRTFVAADLARKGLREVRVHGFAPLDREIALVRRRHAEVSPALAMFIQEIRGTLRRRS